MDRQDRNYWDQKELTRALHDIYSQLVIYKATSDDLINLKKKRIYDSYRWKRCPNYVKHAIEAIDRILFGALFENRAIFGNNPPLEWRVLLDGKHVKGNDIPKDRWADVVPQGGRHFWKDSDRIFDNKDYADD